METHQWEAASYVDLGLQSGELYRRMIHDEVDRWVDEPLVVFEKGGQPTLTKLSDRFTGGGIFILF